jgi:hypothetical protein
MKDDFKKCGLWIQYARILANDFLLSVVVEVWEGAGCIVNYSLQ